MIVQLRKISRHRVCFFEKETMMIEKMFRRRVLCVALAAAFPLIAGGVASATVVVGPTISDINALRSTADVTLEPVTGTPATNTWSGELAGLTKPTGEQLTFLGAFSINNNLLSISGELYSPSTGLPVGDPDIFGSLLESASNNGSNNLYGYLFTVTGGDLADQFGGRGATLGVIIDNQNHTGDVFATVPEPSSAIIFTLLALGAALVNFRRFWWR
jgi:hypothetical protein